MQTMYTIVGLGNPGEKYKNTRHNAGRMVLDALRKAYGLPAWEKDKYAKALVSKGVLGGEEVLFIAPDNYMNNSGQSVATALTDVEGRSERVIVLYDELDMGIGGFKISFNRGSSGHNGVQSIIDALGTKAFTRIRIGISPVSLFGSIKKPKGEQRVLDFILKPFTGGEQKKIEHVSEEVGKAVHMIISEGREKAMNQYNGS